MGPRRAAQNMVHLLVRVFSLVENTRTVDAFSVWRGIRPFVFLNTIKTSEHGRFDAAHELGHLVLPRHGGPSGRRAEDEAMLCLILPDA
ncbi:ImmA/IrrE family metallo-endopeptidase [Rhizobium mongolense]|uniref:ImmA/IrrE family metallo-endopeptidase n=1 Tax=Rhizobium mongolense TaxID=57676 RepID=UPI0035E42BD1